MKRFAILIFAGILLAGSLGCRARGAGTGMITPEEAGNIALTHAGLTREQVQNLHIEYEVDRGVPQYEVEFHHDLWEYDYEISAENGEILSRSKDS